MRRGRHRAKPSEALKGELEQTCAELHRVREELKLARAHPSPSSSMGDVETKCLQEMLSTVEAVTVITQQARTEVVAVKAVEVATKAKCTSIRQKLLAADEG
ncbi:hypothetical protein ACLOJK_038288 [Asimina triloba]